MSAEDSWTRAKGPYETVPPDGEAITALIREMRRRGTAFEPTLSVFARQSAEKIMNDWASAVTVKARNAGIPIIVGTDGLVTGDNTTLPTIHRELQLLVAAGLTPAEALAAATITSARAMKREATHGVIAAGRVADIVLLDANPLEDITATTRIRLVVLRGRLVPRL